MRFKITALNVSNFGTGIVLNLGIPTIYAKLIETIVGEFKPNSEWELKLCRKKRSLDANSLMWAICTEIANAIRQTKEYVYRDAISHVGVYEVMQFNDTPDKSRFDAMKTFKQKWAANGEGWLTKTLDADKCIVQAYYGSSRYDTKEMSVLIDYLMDEAKQMGIQIMSEADIDLIKREWK